MADRRRDEERRFRGERRDPETDRRIERLADRYRGLDERGYGMGEERGRDWEREDRDVRRYSDARYSERPRATRRSGFEPRLPRDLQEHDRRHHHSRLAGLYDLEEFPELRRDEFRRGRGRSRGEGERSGQGYTPGRYDRMPGMSGRSSGYRHEGYGRARGEDERTWHEQGPGRWSAQTYGGHAPDELPEAEPHDWDPREGLRWRSEASEWGPRPPPIQGKAPRGYKRSDERIREDICERLMRSPFDASDVEVTVSAGEVTLRGRVSSRMEKWGIEDVAVSVLGVLDVQNQIRLNRGQEPTADTATLATDTEHLHS